MAETDLTISRGGLPLWSARGCKQELTPIKNGELQRTVNGELVYTGDRSHHKYRSIVRCQDKSSIALDGIWQGCKIAVGCIQRIGQLIQGDKCTLDRQPIESSIRCVTVDGKAVAIRHINRCEIVLKHRVNEGYVSYRPILQMRVVDFGYSIDEWDVATGWYLALEEI